MLRNKQCHVDLFAFQPLIGVAYEMQDPTMMLSPRQKKKMTSSSRQILQYVHFLADIYTQNNSRPEIQRYRRSKLAAEEPGVDTQREGM